jgi:hypothetical protein
VYQLKGILEPAIQKDYPSTRGIHPLHHFTKNPIILPKSLTGRGFFEGIRAVSSPIFKKRKWGKSTVFAKKGGRWIEMQSTKPEPFRKNTIVQYGYGNHFDTRAG